MAIGLEVGYLYYSIGTGDFFHSFFSTIAHNLENDNWGSRFPFIMNELYDGVLKYDHISMAIKELESISLELRNYSCDKVIWDINDFSIEPPWGSDISGDITSLADYFVTNEGSDLITIMFDAMEMAVQIKEDITIECI